MRKFSAVCLLSVVLDGVALEVNLCTLRKKALTTLAATTGYNVATSFSSHTCTEAVLTFADALGRLVGSLHAKKWKMRS